MDTERSEALRTISVSDAAITAARQAPARHAGHKPIPHFANGAPPGPDLGALLHDHRRHI